MSVRGHPKLAQPALPVITQMAAAAEGKLKTRQRIGKRFRRTDYALKSASWPRIK